MLGRVRKGKTHSVYQNISSLEFHPARDKGGIEELSGERVVGLGQSPAGAQRRGGRFLEQLNPKTA